MSEAAERPIIIKRKVVKGGGHHGGAWKVAYADFVTAMMAFFLLMWLINATTEEQKGGIADYFSPDVPMSDRTSAGEGVLEMSNTPSLDDLTDEVSDAEAARVQAELSAELDAGGEANELTRHLSIRMSHEGLVIEIVDLAESGLFLSGSAAPTPLLRRIVEAIGPVIAQARNGVGVTGHTDADAFVGEGGYDNWALSSDRANVARRLLAAEGVADGRFVSVEGKAASQPVASDPFDPRNRRIGIVLYHASHYPLAPAAPARGTNPER